MLRFLKRTYVLNRKIYLVVYLITMIYNYMYPDCTLIYTDTGLLNVTEQGFRCLLLILYMVGGAVSSLTDRTERYGFFLTY